MTSHIKIFLLILLSSISINATTYYVTTSGNNANNGTSEATAWLTITHAGLQAQAGDIVYVKAGTYSNENVDISNSGTSGAKIIFEGYKNTPGDIANTDWWSYPDALDATEMPLLIGSSRSTGGSAFSMLTKKYILIKNFQITNYYDGILLSWSGSAGNNSAENIIVKNIGPGNSPSGRGIAAIYGSYFSIKKCSIVNADGEGISLSNATNSTIDGCKVYCDETTDGTDYYIIITSNDGSSGSEPFANNNTVKNCYIQRADGIPHGGAGIGMKGTCENNIIENCTAKNLKNAAFYVRHSGANNNEIKNCIAIGDTQGDGFIVRDGAHDNTFNNCKTDGCIVAVGFYFSGEDAEATTTGNDNEFYNCLFSKTKYAQMYIGLPDYVKETKDNSFINCVFDDGTYLFDAVQNSSNNSMTNCIVTNIDNYKNGSASLTFNYTNSDFYNNGFSTPSGSNLIISNPQFTNLANADYHLQSGSPCIDAGTSSGVTLPSTDYEGNTRVQGGTVDVGAYEVTPPAPVELISFQAEQIESQVKLIWKTATEINNYGFEVESSVDGESFTAVGFVEGHGNSNTPQSYSLTATDGAKYYRLKQLDTDGGFEYSEVVEVESSLVYKLTQNYPNPFNPTTAVSFMLPQAIRANISIYNALGQKVMEVADRDFTAGTHSVTIDASNLSSGIYFYKLSAGDFVSIKKMMLLK